MSRKRWRLIIAIAILLALLLLIGAAYWNYATTRKIGIDIDFNQAEILPMPQYLYSFSGGGNNRLVRPLGVLVHDGRAYVTDGRRSSLDVFTTAGRYLESWGTGKLRVPLYVARHPITGDYWVSDRRLRSILIFGADGTYKRDFDPKLPKSELPTFDTNGVQWAPLALDFAPDGRLFVTEILNGHRLVIFDKDGKFVRAVGTAGMVADAATGEEIFQFPNSIKVNGNEVWIADSNNRRIQVFGLDGGFKRLVVTQGLPRGFDFLPKASKDEPARFVVIDTLSHDATIWDAAKGAKVLTFGEYGVLEGQFNYPNDTSIGEDRRIYVADTSNGRIQVWGWPAAANPIPTPTTPLGWLACLSPLLFLPLLLLFRRRRYFATRDFVYAIYELGRIDAMPSRRVRWEVLVEDYEELSQLEPQNGVNLAELLHESQFSESDAKALQERYEIEWRDATVLSVAQRAKMFGTEDPELRRVARVLEVPVLDHEEFLARIAAPAPKEPQGPVGGASADSAPVAAGDPSDSESGADRDTDDSQE